MAPQQTLRTEWQQPRASPGQRPEGPPARGRGDIRDDIRGDIHGSGAIYCCRTCAARRSHRWRTRVQLHSVRAPLASERICLAGRFTPPVREVVHHLVGQCGERMLWTGLRKVSIERNVLTLSIVRIGMRRPWLVMPTAEPPNLPVHDTDQPGTVRMSAEACHDSESAATVRATVQKI